MLSSSKLFFSALDAFAFLLHYLKLTEVMSCLNNFLLHFLRKLILRKPSDHMLFSKRGKEKQTVGWYEWDNFKQSILHCIGLWSLSIIIKKKMEPVSVASEIVIGGFCANLSLTLGLPQRKHLAIMLMPTG